MIKQRGFGLFHIIIIVAIVFVGGLGWRAHQKAELAAAHAQEKAEIEKSFGEMRALFGRWADAEKLASSAPRVALAGPVASLQEIKRQVAALTVAPCLVEAKQALETGMSYRVDAYIAFMQQSSISADMEVSTGQFEKFSKLALACKEKP